MRHPDLPSHACYLNGTYTPLNEARVSVLDRGFIFGDGVYEVLPVYGGRVFRFAQHMARLERSLAELRIPQPLAREAWLTIATDLVASYALSTRTTTINGIENAAATGDLLVYLQVTRGVALRDHVMPEHLTPTVFAMCSPLQAPSAQARAHGVACVTADDFRWQKAHIKSTSLLGSVMARQISADVDASETIMFRDGQLSEAASSNVWVVNNGTLMGPPKSNLVLEGIRYDLIQEICQAQGIPFILKDISREEVLTCDELLLSSASKEVLPVTQLDGLSLGHASHRGAPGPVYCQLYAGYQAAKNA
ncbi:MAG: aminotransferase class IV [Burkholderiaceae bacterium]